MATPFVGHLEFLDFKYMMGDYSTMTTSKVVVTCVAITTAVELVLASCKATLNMARLATLITEQTIVAWFVLSKQISNTLCYGCLPNATF